MPHRYVIAVATALLSSNVVVVEAWKTTSFVQLQQRCSFSSQNSSRPSPHPQRTVSSRIRVDGASTSHLYAEINNRRSFLVSSGAALASVFLTSAAAKAVISPLESSGYPYTPSPLPTSVKTAAELASLSSSQSKPQNQAKGGIMKNSDLLIASNDRNVDMLEEFGKKLSSSSSVSSQYPFTPSPLPTSVKTAKELTDSTSDSLPSSSLARPTGNGEGKVPLYLQDFIEEASRQKQIEPLSHGV